jgi:large subunit ribosomal protein L19
MHTDVIAFNQTQRTADHPEIRTGDVIRLHRKITEGEKERVQIFEGLVIRIQGKQSSSPMLTVRKTSFGIGVEIMIPLYSPIVSKIEIVKKTKTRRSRLYFVRKKTDRELRKKLRATTVNMEKKA